MNKFLCFERVLCVRLHRAPVDDVFADAPTAAHFVGFAESGQYHRAIAVFGLPDFIHRTWDQRAASEIAPNDRVIFARYYDKLPSPFGWDDSNQPDDPAAKER
jgi:hypothetical protein